MLAIVVTPGSRCEEVIAVGVRIGGAKYSTLCMILMTVICIFGPVYVNSLSPEARGTNPAKHPMLFYGPEDVMSLQRKARSTHLKIARILNEAGRSLKERSKDLLPPESFERFAKNWNEVYGNNICAFAMYCVLNPDDAQTRDLMLVYMDRMASYPDWYVASSRGEDEVPIGHSLSGFATAFDFLYPHIDESRRAKYLEKLRDTTKLMYDVVMKNRAGWTKQYIHNHAPTNCLALLLGAMICELHDAVSLDAKTWKQAAITHFERAMELLSYVTDGTSDEGAAYGSYSSRGWTQYAFLAKRHFNKDHTNNPWFRQHFWFFYGTVLPGYQRTVGIADSNHNWFYGPESQLVFLDAFVMRNGYGNWLADQIRTNKPEKSLFARSSAQMWSTTHTEFLFYDASIAPVAPLPPSHNKLHVYNDWGVVTYGGGQSEGKTFLSMKSGAIHGEGVAEIVEEELFSSFVKGWLNFNPGHEHPDQNSFVFAPNGRSFITEALYSAKQSYLNNVLQFSPHEDAKCHAPWVGQVGECSKWLAYSKIPVPRGRIVTASQSGDMVHIAGEAAGAYSSDLGLKSVQRSMVLLHPEVLLVLDSVYLHEESKLTKASAFFHNILNPFHPHQHQNFQGAKIIYPEGPYSIFWFHPDGKSPSASLDDEEIACEYKTRTTHYVNVTYDLNPNDVTHMAYLFVGPQVKVDTCYFASDSDIPQINIIIAGVQHKVTIASLTTSLYQRMRSFGVGIYAQVNTATDAVLFGAKTSRVILNRCDVTDDATVVQALLSSKELEVSLPQKSVASSPLITGKSDYKFSNVIFDYVIISCSCLVLLFFLVVANGKTTMDARCQKPTRRILFVILFFWTVICCKQVYSYYNSPSPDEGDIQECVIPHPIEELVPRHPPNVFIASLPSSGAELLGELLRNSNDFLYLTSDDVTIPVPGSDVSKVDPCYWSAVVGSKLRSESAHWFTTLSAKPDSFIKHFNSKTPIAERAKEKYRRLNGDVTFALNLLSGFWNTKLAWLHSLSPDINRFIVVVRDPRDWIYALIRDDLEDDNKRRQQETLQRVLLDPKLDCPASLDYLPWEYQQIWNHVTGSVVEKLANQWAANVATMLRTARSVQIVRFEDLVADPEFASREIMRRLGTTVSLPQINRLTRAVHSGYKSLNHEPPIREGSVNAWKGKLLVSHLRTIERICGDEMKKLMYI